MKRSIFTPWWERGPLLFDLGKCQCGCDLYAPIANDPIAKTGMVAGKPIRFIPGHQCRKWRKNEYSVSASGCWEWNGARHSGGYGKMNHRYAHRVYYERYVGRIQAGFVIDHLCKNPPCVNPKHLEAVTPAVNTQRSSRAKINKEIAEYIRNSNESRASLQKKFGVGNTVISRVKRGLSWA